MKKIVDPATFQVFLQIQSSILALEHLGNQILGTRMLRWNFTFLHKDINVRLFNQLVDWSTLWQTCNPYFEKTNLFWKYF